jgi:hypothetical protein
VEPSYESRQVQEISPLFSEASKTGSMAHPVSYPLGKDVKQPGRRLRMSGEVPPPHKTSMRARLLRMILGVYCGVLFGYITFIRGLHKGGSVFPVEVGTGVLGEFAKLRKASISFVVFVRSSARNDSAPARGIFMKFDVSTLRISVQKIQVSLKSNKNNR